MPCARSRTPNSDPSSRPARASCITPSARALGLGLGLALWTAAVYSRALYAGFIEYDDPLYVTQNAHVLAGLSLDGVRWAFGTLHASNWHPLTWLSHMLDVELFGLAPAGHHATNVSLHALNTLLLFALLRSATGSLWRSALVAALFAVHPLHVQSVAWIAERKDLLSTAFGLGSLLAYTRYARSARASGKGSRAAYAAVCVLLALGLMAKAMLVTLPCVLLLLDVWPLGRTRFAGPADAEGPGRVQPLRALLVEKLPLLLLSVAASAVAIAAQRSSGAIADLALLGPGTRLATALMGYAAYLQRLVWPAGLAVFQPHPGGWPAWQVGAAGLLLGVLTALALRSLRARPYLSVGWLWFLGTLLPVIGLVQIGYHWIADRYTYLPLIGIFVALAWGLAELARSLSAGSRLASHAAVAAASVALLACSARTWSELGHWQTSRRLFERGLEVTQDNAILHYNLARVLVAEGELDTAADHLQASARLRPGHAKTRFYLGLVAEQRGDPARAVQHYRAGLALAPGDALAQARLGLNLARLGRREAALDALRRALELDPAASEPRRWLAELLAAAPP